MSASDERPILPPPQSRQSHGTRQATAKFYGR
jgi:hypothetical protein